MFAEWCSRVAMSGIGDGLPAWWKPKNGYRDKIEAQRAKSVDGISCDWRYLESDCANTALTKLPS